jgi:hypothetical protein
MDDKCIVWKLFGKGRLVHSRLEKLKYHVAVDWARDKLINARGISNARLGKGKSVQRHKKRSRASGLLRGLGCLPAV